MINIIWLSIEIFKEVTGLKITDFSFVSGHSLGEFTALVASESMSLKTGVHLVHLRGAAMQACVPSDVPFSMNALLVINGPGFQTIAYESLLSIETTEDQFHGGLHFKQSVFVIHGQKHALWSVIKLQEYRADAAQKRCAERKF